MATPTQLADSATNSVADTAQAIFTAPSTGNGVLIDSFTAANQSTANASYKAYITGLGEPATNPVIPYRIVVWNEIDLGGGLINQLIPPGGALQVEQSTANSIYFTVSGKAV
jgi:hypothetical protein